MIAVATLAPSLFLAGAVLRASGSPRADAPQVSVEAAVRPVADAGSLDETIASLQAQLRAHPDDARKLASLGFAYVQQARVTADPAYYPKAEAVLRRSIDLGKEGGFEVHVGLGSLDLARHDFARALEQGEIARVANPYNATVRGVIGDALIELGRYDEGFAAVQEMVTLRPSLDSYARVSYARELQGDVRGGVASMRAALMAASAAPDRAWAANQLGELYWNSGRPRAATTWYRRAIELSPEFVPARAGLAKAAWARGDVAEAIRRYQDVVERYPSPEYAAALGDVYASQGQLQLADQQYAVVQAERDVLRANGVNVDLELSLFDSDHGDPAGALAAAQAEWSRRHSIHVADAYAWALYRNGRLEEAAGYSQQALQLGTKNALFLFHAGMIERARGNDASARAFLRQAVSVNPDFSISQSPVALRALANLGGAA